MQRRDFLALLSAALVLPPDLHAAPSVTKVLVGATPGGGTDIVARSLAADLEQRLKHPFIVENRGGAAGNIAAVAVAKAEPDGGTLLLSYTSHAINPALFDKKPFDPIKDFTPISLIASSPLILVARPGLEANNVRELIALAKAKPGKISLAVAGVGSANHLAGEMFKHEAGVDIVSVPYKGAGPAVADVVGSQADLLLGNVATVQPLLQAGKIKGLGVSCPQRLAAFPKLAPIADVIPNFDYRSWYGLLGPAGMAPETVKELEAAAAAAVASPAMRRRLTSEGLDPVGNSAAQFTQFLQGEITRWAKVVSVTQTRLS
ncbi:tripartite tricarboxylate transporter substrate binding protein [Cupriavidus sp.]|uniref:tripartite tricarboxylate transporter substrate binding protein n=1 Tax=Cupriavidus sp. TaxID=1873897 RepID=UPI0025C0BCEA|nr:tripartite tricarboxylate transporter substrate binding protein [Cupriavidus sp.]MCA3188493.1 tripartite tricarboxylate transporter substrate binding protein [Cupriavidus sp.]MCA3199483.1 tripartite tricarboxylate transporter substrate binding protein [Cupriavidus sp.]MCA3204498.1 tripartite tricarboxylate transporter substrate binding protein [Cupriavidus sp.]MCA3206010.1 tripartite tricarboxylate transporter substrate binding protein [Cupriavidus sp.]MCA3236088.1 tripartite tricarboxylate